MRILSIVSLAAWIASAATPASASDTCTIMYDLDVAFHVSDTDFGKGDAAVPVAGSVLIQYPQDDNGEVVDGKVKVLHFAMYENFVVDSLVTVTTHVHHFAPTCNGESKPTWRQPGDPGFPKVCEYRGNRRAVAIGSLRRDAGSIEWEKCKAATTYWSKDRNAYTTEEKSRGKGCLSDMHALGNVRCDGRLGCRIGKLNRGNNPIYLEWTQPLIPGPPGTPAKLAVSQDLVSIRSPKPRAGGGASYNLPSASPSRLWFSFDGTRNAKSALTTCR